MAWSSRACAGERLSFSKRASNAASRTPDAGVAPLAHDARRRGQRVQRGALDQRTPERLDDRLELLDAHALAVRGAGRPRDVLVHQGAPEVVGAGLASTCRAPSAPILTQLTWMLSMSPA